MSFGQRKLDREKPEIDFPEGDAPTELVIQDLIEGKGAEVVPGSRVLAHYVGVAFSTGEEFDAAWNRGEPLPFQVGGRRRLEIPASMAYGDRGAGSVIKPGESLIFVVDLVDVS